MQTIFDLTYLFQSIPIVAKGIPTTLAIAGVAFFWGSLIGLATALLRIYPVPLFSQLALFYISFIRGTPLLVQIFLIYYGIPLILQTFGKMHYISDIHPIYYLFVAFSLNTGAYLAENFRAAIESVNRGQMEAAYSIGMTTPQALLKIIFPQALENGLPAIGNQALMLVKNTSLAFIIGVPEIIGEAKIIGGRTSRIFEVYFVAAMLYWGICLILERILFTIEARLKRHKGSRA